MLSRFGCLLTFLFAIFTSLCPLLGLFLLFLLRSYLLKLFLLRILLLSLFFELFLADVLLFLLLSEDLGEDGLLPLQIGVLHNFVNFALVSALRHRCLNGQSTPFPFLLVHHLDGCKRFLLGAEFYEAKATIQVTITFQWHIYFNYRTMLLEFFAQMCGRDVEAKIAYNDPSSMWFGFLFFHFFILNLIPRLILFSKTCCLLLAFLLSGLIGFLRFTGLIFINCFLIHELTFVLFFIF